VEGSKMGPWSDAEVSLCVSMCVYIVVVVYSSSSSGSI
jgi:hypothetical protein